MIQAFREEIFHKYMHVSHRVAKKTNEKLDAVGLHRGQPVLLHLLWEKDGLSGKEISELMEVQPATVTKMVRRLKSAGFVKTEKDHKDSRISRVFLTDQGRDIEGEVKGIFKELQNSLFQGFDEGQLNELSKMLEQMKESITTMTDNEVEHNE